MKHFWVKFNHGVEIGAALAYGGHSQRTREKKIFSILRDELEHRRKLNSILIMLNETSSPIIDAFFTVVGKTIRFLCKYSPIWSLNFVARSMEIFAIMNYEKLAVRYPQYKGTFLEMARCERDHEEYFRLGPVRYKSINALRRSIIGGVGGLKYEERKRTN